MRFGLNCIKTLKFMHYPVNTNSTFLLTMSKYKPTANVTVDRKTSFLTQTFFFLRLLFEAWTVFETYLLYVTTVFRLRKCVIHIYTYTVKPEIIHIPGKF